MPFTEKEQELVDTIEAHVNQIRPHLAGLPGPTQGVILAELLSIWLAGHDIPGNPKETKKLREAMLTMHLASVRKLVPINAELYGPDA